jgi:hypothetical protein
VRTCPEAKREEQAFDSAFPILGSIRFPFVAIGSCNGSVLALKDVAASLNFKANGALEKFPKIFYHFFRVAHFVAMFFSSDSVLLGSAEQSIF